MKKANSGEKLSKTRQKLNKIDLTKDLTFNYTLLQLSVKYDVSKSKIQTVLTQQLKEKQNIAEGKKLNPMDSGWEEMQLLHSGVGEWTDSPERKLIKAYKKELNN